MIISAYAWIVSHIDDIIIEGVSGLKGEQMKCHFLYTTLLTISLTTTTALAEVRVTDHTEKTRQEIKASEAKVHNSTKTTPSKSTKSKKASETKAKPAVKSSPSRVPPKYVLEDRKTGKIVSFSEASVVETVESLRALDVPLEKWHSCSATNAKAAAQKDPSLEDLETSLEVSLLIESLAKIPAPELTDSQRDWVKSLSPCAPGLRLHLKALGLILTNYKLLTKPDA